MGSYNEILDQLIAVKKVKGHKVTKKESEDFATAWSELVAAEKGFSQVAEYYFYEGFIFAGARPFVQWVLSSDDKYSSLESLFKGSLMGQEKATFFRILISSLAQLILLDASEIDLICQIIKRIPQASKNKKNKTIGDGQRVILKYFVGELNKDIAFPILSNLNIKTAFIKSFVEVFDELLGRVDLTTTSDRDVQTIIAINNWLHPSVKSDENESETKQPGNEKVAEVTPSSMDKKGQDTKPRHVNPYSHLIDLLTEAASISDNLGSEAKKNEKKVAELHGLNRSYHHEIDMLNSQLNKYRQKESAFQEKISNQTKQIAESNLRIVSLEKVVSDLNSELEEKREEIVQRTQMIDALSRDRAKQFDEQIQRLASTLRVEYRDFKEAEASLMSIELGENMREQLKNVFSILKKVGIKLD